MFTANTFAEHNTEQSDHDFHYSAIMDWTPSYTISDKLLSTMRGIGKAIGAINAHRLTDGIIGELREDARALSCYAATGLVGKPLALAEIKRMLNCQQHAEQSARRELLDYDEARRALCESVRRGSLELSIKTLECLQGHVVAGRATDQPRRGVLRQQPSIVRQLYSGGGVYVPPCANDIPPLVARVMFFVNRNIGVIDPVILAGVFYQQSVIIHPFLAGNCRTACLMSNALLGRIGDNLFDLVSLEYYFYCHRDRYDAAMALEGDYYDFESQLDLSEWLEFFAEGVLHELHRVLQSLQKRVFPESYVEPHQQQIIKHIERHGSTPQQEYSVISSHGHASLKDDFERLAKLGLIESKGIGKY
jgi:Fic family protein